MEDSLDRREQGHRYRKLIAGSVIFFLSFLLIIVSPAIINQLYPVPSPDNPPSHSITMWISPVDEEFFLNVIFYKSEQDVVEREDKLFGASFRVNPSDYEQTKCFLNNIHQNQFTMWVKIYFDYSETPCVIHSISVGQMVISELLGTTIKILIEPNQ